jgi:hypothetical protein
MACSTIYPSQESSFLYSEGKYPVHLSTDVNFFVSQRWSRQVSSIKVLVQAAGSHLLFGTISLIARDILKLPGPNKAIERFGTMATRGYQVLMVVNFLHIVYRITHGFLALAEAVDKLGQQPPSISEIPKFVADKANLSKS